jgi:hypothetical protein
MALKQIYTGSVLKNPTIQQYKSDKNKEPHKQSGIAYHMPACLVVKPHCDKVTHILHFIWNQLKSDLIIHSAQLPSNINIVQLIFNI